MLYNFKEINQDHRKIYLDTSELYENFVSAKRKLAGYKGSMTWKKVQNRKYLFRLKDRFGNGRSLGRFSAETQKIYDSFHKNKKETQFIYQSLKSKLKIQAKICKAVGLPRVPATVTSILRVLENDGFLDGCFVIVGTNALYAYEMAAGIFFENTLTATEDIDFLWDPRSRLSLYLEKNIQKKNLLHLLSKVDSTFRSIKAKGFRAVNKDGMMVDLIKPIPRPLWKKERKSIGGPNDLQAAHVKNIEWLLSSPKLTKVVIGGDGYPAKMIVPDPRSFAMHKFWLSNQTDRDPLKKPRDLAQALSIVALTLKYLPHLPFEKSDLKMFPKKVIDRIFKELEKESMPMGFK